MIIGNQTSTRSKDEIRIFAPWAFYLFTAVFLTIAVLFVTVEGMDHNAPRFAIRCLLGALMGAVLGCYAVLIGYVNQDAGRRSMSRLLWTLIAIFVPNGLGIVLYFVLRKPRLAHCSQCNAEVEPGFSFCPRCRNRLQPACPHCQRSVDLGNKFCPYCGGTLDPATGVSSAAATNQP
jgi:RNA polymerase subunit RPABC4/transcription elongation factor Spt4